MSKHIDIMACSLYALLAFILSAWLLQFNYFIGYDGVWYARIAENIMAGKGICVNIGEPYLDHPPLYPFLIGLINIFLANLELSSHLIPMLAFSLTIFPLFFLTKKIYSANAAHWASILYATNGFLLIHSNLVLAESLLVLLTLTQFYWVHKMIQEETHPFKTGIMIGMLAGLAYLARPEGLTFYLAGILAIFLCHSQYPKHKKKAALVSMVVFLMFFTPYLCFLYKNTHKIRLSGAVDKIFIERQMDVANPGKYLQIKKIYEGLTEDKTRLKLDELAENFNLITYFTKDHYALLKSGFPSFIYRWLDLNKYLFGGFGFFLIGASFLGRPWDQQRKKSELLLFLFLLTVIPQFFGVFHTKRFFLYFPVFLIWMGNGIDVLGNWSKSSFNSNHRSSILVSTTACLLLALLSGWYLQRAVKNDPTAFEYKDLGLWMKENIPGIKEERVVSWHPSVNFYSGAKTLNYPYLPYVDKFDDFLVYMKHQRAKYFVIGDNLQIPTLDAYRFLLDETRPLPAGIIRKHTVTQKYKVTLLEISGNSF